MTSPKYKKILIVGGAGFAGHRLALTLKSLGCEVTVTDSLAVNNLHSFEKKIGQQPNVDLYLDMIKQRLELFKKNGIVFIEQDARDYHEMSRRISDADPEVLIHLAAVAHANVSNKDPYSTFDHSLRTLENSLDNSRAPNLNIKQFIYFSSSMVYGHFESGEVTEETICNPLGIYGALKYAGEKMVIAYNQVFDLPYTIIRPSALYGERCVRRGIGQIFIENALDGKSLTVNGDGSERLDFTYIEDLVQGIVKAIGNEKALNETFNITYGSSRSIADLTGLIIENFPDTKVEYVPKDKLTPDRGTLSIEKAKNLLGYDPQFPIEKGFGKYIEWYKEYYKNKK